VTLDDPFAAAWAVVLDGSARDAYAGAVALVLHRRGVVLRAATGWACREPAFSSWSRWASWTSRHPSERSFHPSGLHPGAVA
jgi:hypothetical protein